MQKINLKLLITVLLVTIVTTTGHAQNNAIFDGGIGDGFDHTSFKQVLNNSIFGGGIGDGFDHASFKQALNNSIFGGGPADGFDAISIAVNPISLPIELLYFKGHREKETNFLNWVTISEIDNDYFLLERSFNGIDFNALKKIEGAGTSTVTQSYAHKDPVVPLLGNPVVYYRLIQVDFDGTKYYSDIIAIDLPDEKGIPTYHIYPNPTATSVMVKYSGVLRNSINDLVLVDELGRIQIQKPVSSERLHNGYQFDLESVPPGAYQLIIKIGQRMVGKTILKIGL